LDAQAGAVLPPLAHGAEEGPRGGLDALEVLRGGLHRRPRDVGEQLIGPVRRGKLELIALRLETHLAGKPGRSEQGGTFELAGQLRLEVERHLDHVRIGTGDEPDVRHRQILRSARAARVTPSRAVCYRYAASCRCTSHKRPSRRTPARPPPTAPPSPK